MRDYSICNNIEICTDECVQLKEVVYIRREENMRDFTKDPRFEGIKSFENRVWLSSPTMHGEEQKWINDAFEMLVA